MATPGPANMNSKPTANTPVPSAPPSQPSSTSQGTNEAQRRGGGNNSGAGTPARNIPSAPRNQQGSRRSHKNHKRPELQNDVDNQIAMAAVNSNSRKGTSITHLINWDVAAPRPTSYNDFRPRPQRRPPTWGLGSGYHATDKARYINANYRFIVNPNGDYRAQAVDSDVHLEWNLVLQVLASALTQCPNCPICLSTPVAPRMAKCGHIFCLSCLIRYMASSPDDKQPATKSRYKKCVICTDSVYMNDVKPVRFFTGQENEQPKNGQDVVLRLLMRKQGSTLALPKDGADQLESADDIPWYFAAEVMDYARIMKGTEDYMIEQFQREISELKYMEQEDSLIFGDSNEWTRKAVSMIRAHMDSIKGTIGNPITPPSLSKSKEKEKEKEEPKDPRPSIEFNESDDIPLMYQLQSPSSNPSLPTATPATSSSSLPLQSALVNPTVPTSNIRSSAPETRPGQPYYFYQALPHYYLSPLDIRILRISFGSFSSFPSTILPRVESVSTGHIIDDDLRRRAKYLAHLPSGCEIAFLECDWTDIVPAATLAQFSTDIERRRKIKRDKEIKEERDRIRAEKLEDDQRYAQVRHSHTRGRRDSDVRIVGGSAEEHFSADDFVPLHHAADYGSSPTTDSTMEAAFSHLSINNPAPGTSLNHVRTVWGTTVVAGLEDAIGGGEVDSGWREDWERELLEEDLRQIEMEERWAEEAGVVGRGSGPNAHGGKPPSHGKGQKRKKFKKVTLMTNGGKRGA